VLGVKNFITWWRTVRLLRVAAIVKKNIVHGIMRKDTKKKIVPTSSLCKIGQNGYKYTGCTFFSDLMKKEMRN
jgi:hypothetical protein